MLFPFPDDFYDYDSSNDAGPNDDLEEDREINPLNAVYNIAHALQAHKKPIMIAELAECLDGVVTRDNVLEAIRRWIELRVIERTSPQQIRFTAYACNLEPD